MPRRIKMPGLKNGRTKEGTYAYCPPLDKPANSFGMLGFDHLQVLRLGHFSSPAAGAVGENNKNAQDFPNRM